MQQSESARQLSPNMGAETNPSLHPSAEHSREGEGRGTKVGRAGRGDRASLPRTCLQHTQLCLESPGLFQKEEMLKPVNPMCRGPSSHQMQHSYAILRVVTGYVGISVLSVSPL